MELEDLRAQMLRGQQAKSSLRGLDEGYKDNVAMRDAAQPTINKYGTVSPLAILANTMRKSRGRKGIRENAQARTDAGAAVDQAAMAFPMYQAGVAADKVTQDQQNFDASALAATTAAKLKADALVKSNQQKMDREDAKVPTTSKMNPADGKEYTVRYNAQTGKAFLDDGTEIANYSEWTDPPTKTITFAGGGYDDKGANKRAEEAIITLGKINTAIGYTKEFDDATVERLNSVRERLIKGGTELLPSQAKQLIQSERESNPAVKKYYSYLSALSGAQRHALFGSALTNVEKMSADEFLAAVSVLPLEEQVMRLRNGVTDGKEALQVMDSIHGGKATRYTDSFNSMGFDNLGEPAPAAPAPVVYTTEELDAMPIEQLRAIAAGQSKQQ